MADRAEPEDLRGRAANATAPVEPARVFVSYASPDAAVASALVESLERHGIACWIAPRDVKAGALYADAIVRAISGAKALVLLLSESAIGSSHVGKEVERASSKKRPIIALRIDNAPLTPALEYFLSESQWIEAQSENRDSAYARLVDAIQEPERAAPRINPAVTPPVGTAPAVYSRGLSKRILIAAVLTVVGLAVAALLAGKFWLGKRIPTEQPKIAATNVVSDKSIAVLPFADLSEKHDQEYFGDGMAAEILALLGKLPGVRVVGLRSSSQFKARTDDLRTIGAKLDVAYVVDGSIQRSADRIRVATELIDTRDGVQRWSDVYDRNLSDVIGVQDQIVSSVARVLQVGVGEEFGSRVRVRNSAAYDLYLRGLHALDKQSRSSCEEAAADFQRALEIDPEFAEASAGLATAYWIIGDQVWLPAREAFEHARQAAENAIRLNPKLGVAHAALAEVHLLYDWNWAGADSEANLALSLGAGVEGAKAAARVAATFGRWDRARQLIKSGLAIDPFDPMLHMNLAYVVDLRSGRFAEAAAEAKRTLDLSPEYASALYFRGVALLLQGHLDEALATMQHVKVDDSGNEGLAIVYFALGRKAESDAALQRAIAQDGEEWPYGIATTMSFRHETDKAISWLEHAYAHRDSSMYTIKGEPLFRSIEDDRRYKAILRKMNLPE